MRLPRYHLPETRRLRRAGMVQVEQWRRRIATLAGALIVGLIAVMFAHLGEMAQRLFYGVERWHAWSPLVLTPLMFLLLAWVTTRLAPEAAGSGIPQVIAASRNVDNRTGRALTSLRGAFAKLFLTIGALMGGASVGREGPTVQVAAAVMVRIHKLFGVKVTPGVLIAGGAAGVAAAFNTPLAGIAFAIEELAVAYEQRVAVLAMGAVMIAGLTAQGLAGNYVYFGVVPSDIPLGTMLIVAPVAGVFGGALGGLFARLMLAARHPDGRWARMFGKRPLLLAFACGVIVAAIGVASGGATWGTGYEPTVALMRGEETAYLFGPAKFIASLATSVSGIPGGIFAPSLAVGAGFGELLTPFFEPQQAGAVVLLGMAGYFVGVVRAPLTAVIILSEATGTTSIILPLFATALIGDWAGSVVCRERLYHALARNFMPPRPAPPTEGEPEEDGEAKGGGGGREGRP